MYHKIDIIQTTFRRFSNNGTVNIFIPYISTPKQ